jgi:hypothetical protein
MKDVSLFRLYLLRATYALLLVGLAFDQWPGLFHHPDTWSLMRGVVCSMLTAVSLVAILGICYPLQMLPLLLFETAWKLTWLAAFALPRWTAGTMDANTWETTYNCLFGLVVFAIAMPWGHLFTYYVRKSGERWR